DVELQPRGMRSLLVNALEVREEPLATRKILVMIDDITERKRASEALEAAKLVAEQANLGKSRFLAAASHDLRQPLQTLSLLRGILGKRIKDQSGSRLVTMLEETLRNLLANAVKYTERGKILLGCRRRGDKLRIEAWDTGIGIPAGQLKAIFEEFHQLDNPARERNRGLGLGLSIVQRISDLLGHTIEVHSWPDRGSVFAIEVPLGENKQRLPSGAKRLAELTGPTGAMLDVQ